MNKAEQFDILQPHHEPQGGGKGNVLIVDADGTVGNLPFGSGSDAEDMLDLRPVLRLSGGKIVEALGIEELHLILIKCNAGQPAATTGEDHGRITAVQQGGRKGCLDRRDGKLAALRILGDEGHRSAALRFQIRCQGRG